MSPESADRFYVHVWAAICVATVAALTCLAVS